MGTNTPRARASYEAAATTPRWSAAPPTTTGWPAKRGLSSCSTEVKNASRSTWATTRVAGSTAGGWFTLAIIRNVSFRKACLPTGDRAMGLCYRIPRRNVRFILGID
jgi:hypothetical protein